MSRPFLQGKKTYSAAVGLLVLGVAQNQQWLGAEDVPRDAAQLSGWLIAAVSGIVAAVRSTLGRFLKRLDELLRVAREISSLVEYFETRTYWDDVARQREARGETDPRGRRVSGAAGTSATATATAPDREGPSGP